MSSFASGIRFFFGMDSKTLRLHSFHTRQGRGLTAGEKQVSHSTVLSPMFLFAFACNPVAGRMMITRRRVEPKRNFNENHEEPMVRAKSGLVCVQERAEKQQPADGTETSRSG
jgi:hypothetical protein